MKATEDESKRSPTRRRLFGPVDHNQNRVDASLIWTNINPGFPRVDYSPRFRHRPVDMDGFTEAGRGAEGTKGEVEMEGEVRMECSVETEEYGGKGETDQRRSTGISSVQSADYVIDASLLSAQNWNQNAGSSRSDKTTMSNLPPSGGTPSSPTGSSADRSSTRRKRLVSYDSINDCIEESDHIWSSYSPMSLDPSCRIRPATCPWRTLARVDPAFTDEGRMRSASLGHASRPSCSRHRSCRSSCTAVGSRGSPDLEPAYKKVPVVQLRGSDVTGVLCPPGHNYFFKPIEGGEVSPAITASQSPDEGGDDESSGGTRGSIVDSRLLQEIVASAENGETTDGVLRGLGEIVAVDCSCVGPGWAGEEQCTVPKQQQQSIRRRRLSNDDTHDSSLLEKDEEVAGHVCSNTGVEGSEERRADRKDLSGCRIKDKLVTTPPRPKRR